MTLPGPDRLIAAAIVVLVYIACCGLILWRHRAKRRSALDTEKVRSRSSEGFLAGRRAAPVAAVGGRPARVQGDAAAGRRRRTPC